MLSEIKNPPSPSIAGAPNASSSSSTCLKRKRPPKIEIPNVLREITIQPLPTKHHHPRVRSNSNEDSNNNNNIISSTGFGVALYSIKGKKFSMEDTHFFLSSPLHNKGFFGVYDGHGGSKAAQFVADNLHTNIQAMLDKCPNNSGKEEAIRAGFLKTDQDFLKQDLTSGTCCVTALIEGKELVISNVGDCRAVLSRGGVAEALTEDHRASHADERKRIENKGGYVTMHRGAWRVHGVLSVSRSIGDAHLKDWVLAEPDTKVLSLTSDMEYLVLASDGLWEGVGNQEAIDIVIKSRSAGKKNMDATSDTENAKNDEYDCVITSPSPKVCRVSLIKQKKRMDQSPGHRRRINCWKKNTNDFGSENESPPHKAQRISVVNQMKMELQSPNQENCISKTSPTSGGLMAACKELVNLALTRGSLDDITVMIIDLNDFNH